MMNLSQDFEFDIDCLKFDECDASNELSLSDMGSSSILCPIIKTGPPARGDFPGDLNFEVELDGENTDRSKYVYSHELNRVYMVMAAKMSVGFRWDFNKSFGQALWVRATPIFSGNEYQEFRVLRCFLHHIPTDVSNHEIPLSAINHVMHSVSNRSDTFYCGTVNNNTEWLNVAVFYPGAPEIGSVSHHHVFRFGCKHSCTSGINRRKIEVLFTLEDCDGNILGRRSLGIRVCSCPRRDMEKELNELKNINVPSHKTCKKRKLSKPADTQTTNPSSKEYVDLLNSAMIVNQLFVTKLPPSDPATEVIKNTIKDLTVILQKKI